MGINYGGPDKFKPTLFHVFAYVIGHLCFRGYFFQRLKSMVDSFAAGKRPDVFIKGPKFFPDFDKSPGVGNCPLNLQPVADNTADLVSISKRQELLGFGLPAGRYRNSAFWTRYRRIPPKIMM